MAGQDQQQVNGKFTQQYYAAALTYRVNDGPAALDLVGGVPYNDLRIRLQVATGLLAPRSDEESKGWADGFIGARVVVPLNERSSFVGYGDVGVLDSDACSCFGACSGCDACPRFVYPPMR